MVPMPPGRATKASPRSSMMAFRSRSPSVTTSSVTAVSPTPRSSSARGITPVTSPPCSSTERESAPMSPTRPPPYTRRQRRFASFSPSSTATAKYFASTTSLEPQNTVTAPIMPPRRLCSRRLSRRGDGGTEGEGGVATEPRGLRAQEGGALEPLPQLGVAHRGDMGSSRVRRGRVELAPPRHRRLPVPRTDALAGIAAELPGSELPREGGLDIATVLDGQVRDAPARVQHVGRDEGLRRAGVEAGATASAAIGERLVYVEGRRGQEHPDEEPRPEIGMEQHGVLADPAEPRPRGQVALENRAGIHVALAARAARLGEIRRQLGQARRHHRMVVASPRVAGHRRPGGVAGCLALVVVESDADDGAGAGQHARGIEPLAGAAGEIAHGRAVAGLQPPRERGTMF